MDLLENNTPAELNKLLPLDFKKFIRPKKELTNEELRKLFPKAYYNLIEFFLQKSADILPPHWPNNYAINLEEGKILPYKRLYLILRDELLAVKKYIDKHLNKGFIRPSISPIAAPILLAKKLKGGI